MTGEEDCDGVVFARQLQECGDELEFTVEGEDGAVGFRGDEECFPRVLAEAVGVRALDDDVGGLDGRRSRRGVLLGKRRVGDDVDIVDGDGLISLNLRAVYPVNLKTTLKILDLKETPPEMFRRCS